MHIPPSASVRATPQWPPVGHLGENGTIRARQFIENLADQGKATDEAKLFNRHTGTGDPEVMGSGGSSLARHSQINEQATLAMTHLLNQRSNVRSR